MNISTSRFKYFERPIISKERLEQQLPDPNIILAPVPKSLISQQQTEDDKVLSKSVAVQTDYRDSEAQTDPYSPEYSYYDSNNSASTSNSISTASNKPEILILENLTYSNGGLPVITPRIIERINLERKRRLMKSKLPPIQYDNEEIVNIHQKFLEDIQREDYELKERDLDMDVNRRLLEFKQLQIEKENALELLNEERLKEIKDKKMKEHEEEIARYAKKISVGPKGKLIDDSENDSKRRSTLLESQLIKDVQHFRNKSGKNNNTTHSKKIKNRNSISSEKQTKNLMPKKNQQHRAIMSNNNITINTNLIDDEITSSIMTDDTVFITKKKIDYSAVLQSTNKSDSHNRDALKLANDLNLIDAIYNKSEKFK